MTEIEQNTQKCLDNLVAIFNAEDVDEQAAARHYLALGKTVWINLLNANLDKLKTERARVQTQQAILLAKLPQSGRH